MSFLLYKEEKGVLILSKSNGKKGKSIDQRKGKGKGCRNLGFPFEIKKRKFCLGGLLGLELNFKLKLNFFFKFICNHFNLGTIKKINRIQYFVFFQSNFIRRNLIPSTDFLFLFILKRNGFVENKSAFFHLAIPINSKEPDSFELNLILNLQMLQVFIYFGFAHYF